MPAQNAQKSVIAQCQIVVFRWNHEIASKKYGFAELSESDPIDISMELQQVNFEKEMSGPSGSFSFTLPNTRDWKSIIKPGTWCLIYMTNDGDLALPEANPLDEPPGVDLSDLVRQKDRLRGICFIERVSAKGEVNEKGVLDVSYEVAGRDFGVIYEETTIWHNFMLFEQGVIDAATGLLRAGDAAARVNTLLEVMHNLFFSPSDFTSLQNRDPSAPTSLSQVGFQWLLPQEILKALGLFLRPGKNDSFFGHLDGLLDFSDTECRNPIENPLSSLNGNAWEKLKTYSVQEFHELFTETDADGHPKLIFRPIPWGIDASGYPLMADKIKAFSDLANDAVLIDPMDVMGFDLGEDSHARYNHFYIGVANQPNIANLEIESLNGRKFPLAEINSIARYGFRPMHCEVDAVVDFGINKDGTPNTNLLVQINEVMFDYWNSAIFFESGTLEIIGRNDIKVGKGLWFSSECDYNANKLFYIEGYTDSFSVDDKGVGSWIQTLKLTRGVEFDSVLNFQQLTQDLKENPFSKHRETFNGTADFRKGNR